MSSNQYVATRAFPTTHRQYEMGDLIDTSRITSSELNAGVASGAVLPTRFVDTAANLAARNPVVGPGVACYEIDTGVMKIGTTGAVAYNSLPQVGSSTYAGGAGAFAPSPVQRGMRLSAVCMTESGHAWVVDGSGTSNLAVTGDTAIGTQCISGTTDGGGSNFQRLSNYGQTWDTTGKDLVVWLKVADDTYTSSIIFYAGNGASWGNFYLWSVDSNSNPSAGRWLKSGEWVRVTLPFSSAAVTGSPTRTGITRIRIAFRDTGAGALTVSLGAVGLTSDGSAAFPNGVVSFTFDDSFEDCYSRAMSALASNNAAGTSYVIVDSLGGADHMTIAQCRSLQDQAGWDIAAHAYTTAAHDSRFTSLSAADADLELRNLKAWITANGFRAGNHLAWPGGVYNPTLTANAKQYFATARGTHGLAQTYPNETLPAGAHMRLRAYLLNMPTDSASVVNGKIDAAYGKPVWVILGFHRIVASGATGLQYNAADLSAIAAHCNSIGMPIRTVSEVVNALTV